MVVTGISGRVLTGISGGVLTSTISVIRKGSIGVVLTCTSDVVLTGTIGVVLTRTITLVLTYIFMSEHPGWQIVSGLHCDTTDREAMIEVSSIKNLRSPITKIIFNFTTWNNLTVYNYCMHHYVKILLGILCWI